MALSHLGAFVCVMNEERGCWRQMPLPAVAVSLAFVVGYEVWGIGGVGVDRIADL